MTFLAFGNGSPDVFSTFAAMRTNSGSLAIGELVGAASFITAVVAGSMALVRPFEVSRKSFLRDVGFFIVAASFSMIFLADGHLQLWECATMVAFYVFYVLLVVIWQWRASRARHLGEQETHSRGHFLSPEVALPTPEGLHSDHSTSVSLRDSAAMSLLDEFSMLDNSNDFSDQVIGPGEGSREAWLARLSSSMRLGLPVAGPGSAARSSIRPSLVGALEFRALLSSLKRSQTLHADPIVLRRYSDDPNLTLGQQRLNRTNQSPNGLLAPEDAEHLHVQAASDTRDPLHRRRAASAVELGSSSLGDTGAKGHRQAKVSQAMPVATDILPNVASTETNQRLLPEIPSPGGAAVAQFGDSDTQTQPTSLDPQFRSDIQENAIQSPRNPGNVAPHGSSVSPTTFTNEGSRSKNHTPPASSSSPVTIFPPYRDDPDEDVQQVDGFQLPVRSPGLENGNPASASFFPGVFQQPLRWWPHGILPPPEVLVATLFPTMYFWREKNFGQKLLAVITAPSVLLLTITLPVVEPTSNTHRLSKPRDTPEVVVSDSEGIDRHMLNQEGQPAGSASLNQKDATLQAGTGSTASVRNELDVMTTGGTQPNEHSDSAMRDLEAVAGVPAPPGKGWNRWLVAVQILMAPFFVVVIAWANLDEGLSVQKLFTWAAYAMIASLVTLLVVMLSTEEREPPRYRPLLCFVGFVVSVAWISTIANEVVGVLKAFGVILGLSEAILGLTIFAVGNRCILPSVVALPN